MRSHEAVARRTERDLDPAYDDEDENTSTDDDAEFVVALDRSSRMEYFDQSASRMVSPV